MQCKKYAFMLCSRELFERLLWGINCVRRILQRKLDWFVTMRTMLHNEYKEAQGNVPRVYVRANAARPARRPRPESGVRVRYS